MATHTVGSAGDFGDPQEAEDDIPNPTTEQRRFLIANEEFVTSGPPLVISAHDTTAGDIIFEAASGASFMDNASVRSNALRYNAANGAALRSTGGYERVIEVSGANGRLTIRGLQLRQDGGGGAFGEVIHHSVDNPGNHLYKDCIVEKLGGAQPAIFTQFDASARVCEFVNLTVIHHGTGNGVMNTGGTNNFRHCGFYKPTNVTPSGSMSLSNYADARNFYNCGSFGFTTAVAAGFGNEDGDHNATDLSSFGAGTSNQVNVTYSASSPFVNGSAGASAHDFRTANNANALIGNGVLDATNAPNDISGGARPINADIGPWQVTLAGGGGSGYDIAKMYRRPNTLLRM